MWQLLTHLLILSCLVRLLTLRIPDSPAWLNAAAHSAPSCSKTGLVSSSWERRYFFTQGGNLMQQGRGEVAGGLVTDLDNCSVMAVDCDDRRFCFQVTSFDGKKWVAECFRRTFDRALPRLLLLTLLLSLLYPHPLLSSSNISSSIIYSTSSSPISCLSSPLWPTPSSPCSTCLSSS